MTAWLVTGLGLMSHDRNAGGLVILEVTHVIPFCYESYKDQESAGEKPPKLAVSLLPRTRETDQRHSD
ncbi:hypothetical protein MAP00_001461 [Monascus purpureus]|nr:hypothetical protein MAP00_001461 [Monascus purpureus]